MLSSSDRHTTKKRKIRKGTTSCWECKHRKTRCEWSTRSGSICVFCQRRGLSCTSQELPDPHENYSVEEEEGDDHSVEDEIVDQDIVVTGHENGFHLRNGSTAQPLPSNPTIKHSPSAILHSALPEPGIVALIFNRGRYFSLPFHLRQQPGGKPPIQVSNTEQLIQVSKLPKPTDHPVHFACKLIQLALSLQELDVSDKPDVHLDQPVHEAARRFINTASIHVTSHDSLVDTLDGLETLMLEACYYINSGNLRGAWLTFRRALSIAQLIGIPHLAERAGTRHESLWFRLMYGDRFLSLTLGLQHAVIDDTFVQKYLVAVDLPTEQLDRVHFAVLGRIIARNVKMQRFRRSSVDAINGPANSEDYGETQHIDLELKNAARNLSLKWWASTTPDNCTNEVGTIERMGKLVAQMHHHFLLVALHLPILMQQFPVGSTSGHAVPKTPFWGDSYSKTTTLGASREVLTRFIALRDYHRTLSYRAMDDKAMIAAVGLVLVHLNGHHHGLENALDHQRPFDLGLVHKMIDTMKNCSCFENNVVGQNDTRMLESLLKIEEDIADGAVYSMWMDESTSEEQGSNITHMEEGLRLPIPFFGTLHIYRPKFQQSVPELDTMTVENASFITATMQYLDQAPNEFDSLSLDSLLSEQGDHAATFQYQATTNVSFDTWVLGENDTDETVFDIGL